MMRTLLLWVAWASSYGCTAATVARSEDARLARESYSALVTQPALADTLSVLVAVLEHVGAETANVFLPVSSHDLVLAAARVLVPGWARVHDGSPLFCSADDARPGDLVGSVISVSLTPGYGPSSPDPPSPDSVPPGPGSIRDLLSRPLPLTGRGFFMDAEVAFVDVALWCGLLGQNPTAPTRLPDGRLMYSLQAGETLELRREGGAWVVKGPASRWIV